MRGETRTSIVEEFLPMENFKTNRNSSGRRERAGGGSDERQPGERIGGRGGIGGGDGFGCAATVGHVSDDRGATLLKW